MGVKREGGRFERVAYGVSASSCDLPASHKRHLATSLAIDNGAVDQSGVVALR